MKRGWRHIFPGCGKIVGFLRGATPAVLRSPPHWPRAGGAGYLGQWDWGSENARVEVMCLLYYLDYFVFRFVRRVLPNSLSHFCDEPRIPPPTVGSLHTLVSLL